MDRNPQTLQIMDTLSPRPELPRHAKENLSDPADNPNYGLEVLRLVAEHSVNDQIRESAAVDFKKHIETRWLPSSATPIPDGEKEEIKTLIVPVMLSASQKIQVVLSEALGVIGNHDFPESWPDLLPDLKSHLETALIADDFAYANGILATVNSLFKRFRCESSSLYKKPRYESKRKSNRILLDLEYCSDTFGAPLISSFESISRKINTCGSVETLRQLLEAQRLCCRIFYSHNFLGAPEKFEEKADEWMNVFKNCLSVKYPAIDDADCVDEVRAAVCENICLYMEKNEEVLQKHLSDFVEAVCSLLVEAASEGLTVSGIKFLSSVSKSVVHHELLFGGGNEILESIVIPNLMLRDEDETVFKTDSMEFIRRDMEFGTNTRRRNAYELVKGIARNHKEKIKELIDKCLALFDENQTDNWKYKECAISLSTTGDDVVDVENFFRRVIVPELQQKDVNKSFPMLKASALKFFTMFHILIPKHVAMPLFGDVVRFIASDVKVVHSYAATCIEKLLLVKDNKKARYTSMDIDPMIQKDLIDELSDTLGKGRCTQRNHYVMRCLVRALDMAGDVSRLPMGGCMVVLDNYQKAFWRFGFQTNKNRVFNHFLFEAVATIVRRVCEKEIQPDFVGSVQDMFDMAMLRDEKELYPYMFQLLAQLVDLYNRPPVPVPLPQRFMRTFDKYFSVGRLPDCWDNSAILPALFLTLQSYLRRAPNEVITQGRLRDVVLGIINKLVSSPRTEEEGFRLLNIVIEKYEYGDISEYMNHIWASLLKRLQNSKTVRLVRSVIIFMSLFLVKHGVQTLVDLINSVEEPKLFHDVILGGLWIPNLKRISTGCNYMEVKLCAVASIKLLYESASLLDPSAEELWRKLLDATVTLLTLPQEESVVEDDDDEPDLLTSSSKEGFKFVRLKNARKKEEEDWDPLEEIGDPKQFLVAFPAKLSSQFHEKFPLVIKGHLSPPNQTALVELCNSYNIAIV